MRTTGPIRHAAQGPWGDDSLHRPLDELERGLAALAPPRDAGELALIVARGDDGHRHAPKRVRLTPEGGVPGDAWGRNCPEKVECQITVMQLGVAKLIAGEQPLTLFGDNLIVDLDLSVENLPAGSRLRLGGARLEVTPEPHNGCAKYRQRFGGDALRLTADRRFRDLRLRGIHLKVVEEGEIAVGDVIEVLSRGGEP